MNPRATRAVKVTDLISIIVFASLFVLMLIGFIHPPLDPFAMNIMDRFAPPSFAHLMGTDEFGRDLFSRVLVALGTSFTVGFGSLLFGLIGGVIIGGVAGYTGKAGVWLSELLMRLMDAAYAFPHLVLALLFLTVLGPGAWSTVVAIGVFSIPIFARLTFGSVMEGKQLLYVKAAQSMGGSRWYVLSRHILRFAWPILLVQATSSFSMAVLAEAALSFLGVGIQPPMPSLGSMLSDAENYLAQSMYMAIFPGIILLLLVVSVSMIGDALEGRVRR